ncbi:hypothetical protein KP509_11G029600 [Ceratopteris richardii]|uniref:Arf-GAP domain-containing protein n=1 Tax=Ceratopteris richardii TaxID=49495 RepID=A0A8T2TN34_CERRI|nr:hypothetical protein KP509_11G029600 [Ceratopteris richardii]
MKLPENRECADCRSKGPRWASVNLGVFVCIQCSGIHRSLGVHISKVRSATLDTWLPEQVAFMQGMGNAKANAFWEAELPSSFRRPTENDRGGLEAFIRSKYEARRWVAKKDKSPSKIQEERHTPTVSKSDGKIQETSGSEQNSATQSSQASSQSLATSSAAASETSQSKENIRHSIFLPAPKPPQNPLHPVQPAEAPKALKSEVPTDLFDLLNIEEAVKTEDSAAATSVPDDQGWAAFQSAAAESSLAVESEDQKPGFPINKSDSSASTTNAESSTKGDIMAGLEDLFKGSPAVSLTSSDAPASAVSQPQKDVKKEDILSLFGQTPVASPYLDHQRQMAAMLAHRQSILMAAAASGGQLPVGTAGNQQMQGLNLKFTDASQAAGLVNDANTHISGLHFGQVGAPSYLQNSNVQPPASTKSSTGAMHGGPFQYQSLVSSSLSGIGATGVTANGSGQPNSANQSRNMSLLGFSPLSSNEIGQTNTLNNPSPATAFETSSKATGADYDFSALTAAALSKH